MKKPETPEYGVQGFFPFTFFLKIKNYLKT